MPRIDYLAVAGRATAEECGFVPALTQRGRPSFWRPGWWAKEGKVRGYTTLMAKADRGWMRWPVPWGDSLHPTRVDVCCDIEGFTFTDGDRKLFTFRNPRSSTHYHGEDAETLYIGSLSSHTTMLLRIYKKSSKCTDQDRWGWALNGWSGGDVWRIEYELHDRALGENLHVPECAMSLWSDGLARYRMCTTNPRTFIQQNMAPTHELWRQLGDPRKLTRRRAPLPPHRDDAITRAFERLVARTPQGQLHDLLRRLQHAVTLAGGETPHAKKGRDGG